MSLDTLIMMSTNKMKNAKEKLTGSRFEILRFGDFGVEVDSFNVCDRKLTPLFYVLALLTITVQFEFTQCIAQERNGKLNSVYRSGRAWARQ